MYKDSRIKANVFISLMKLKNRENQKYLQKHEVKISKTITVEGNAQIGAGLCFHKYQN